MALPCTGESDLLIRCTIYAPSRQQPGRTFHGVALVALTDDHPNLLLSACDRNRSRKADELFEVLREHLTVVAQLWSWRQLDPSTLMVDEHS